MIVVLVLTLRSSRMTFSKFMVPRFSFAIIVIVWNRRISCTSWQISFNLLCDGLLKDDTNKLIADLGQVSKII